MRPPLLRVERLSAGFERNVVFRRVSFVVPRHGSVGILGPMGAGKSTLLRSLGRWNDLRPSFWVHGQIHWNDEDLLHGVERETANRGLALLQQKARLFTSSVLDNAVAGLNTESMSREEQEHLACSVLEPWGLWATLNGRLQAPVTDIALGEQRMLTLARLIASGAEAILADEPLRDLDDASMRPLEEMLLEVKKRYALVVVTHNQLVAKKLIDQAALIAGGTLIEFTTAEQFFAEPKTELGRTYLRSGSCWPTREQMDPDWLRHQDRLHDEEAAGEAAAGAAAATEVPDPALNREAKTPSWVPTAVERQRRPGGFHWVERGLLGGMQWPGLLQETKADLDGCVALGVRHLVNLTEKPFPERKLAWRPIELHHFPVVDMQAPEVRACLELCERVREWIRRGEATVFHCRAGLGRTGTLLACMRVLDGCSAVTAIDQVRRVNSMYIQSRAQLDFIERFSEVVHGAASPRQKEG